MTELIGKAAVITGASRGIGAATAKQLAERGVSVVLAARTFKDIEIVSADIRRAGGIAETIACDVTRYSDVHAAVEKCRTAFGSIDILVNNAGIIDPIARITDSDPDAWNHVVDVNLKGVYHGLRAALPVMQAQGSGTIINISSGAATSALEGWSHYCATKAAVLSLTKCAHREYAEHGVRVVGLSPGTVATDMQVSIKESGINPVSQLDASAHITTDWAARAVAWLCTEDASDVAGDDFSIKTDEGRRRAGLMA